MIFLTENKTDRRKATDRVEANHWAEAELILKQTRPEEKVIGELIYEIDIPES